MVAIEGQCGGVRGSVWWRDRASVVALEGQCGVVRGSVWCC